ncbi:hypothetical protein BC828DRAFT_402073 [Blastocladiella britannica]|nr:hypothetical protein BC828DRAFT_402073 [Blastocladiella britannica]
MAEVLRILLMRDLDLPVRHVLLSHRIPSRSPSMSSDLAARSAPAEDDDDKVDENGNREHDSDPGRRDDDDTPPPPPPPPLSPVSGSAPPPEPQSPRSTTSSESFCMVTAADMVAELPEPPDTRLEAMLTLRADVEQYEKVFLQHFLAQKNDDHDDMLFYVPLAWPDMVKRAPVPPGCVSSASSASATSDLLIIQRNIATTLTLPPSLPAIDWLQSVWLNVVMQHTYTAEVSVSISHSARILRSYPVYANPYQIDMASNTVTCSWPYIYFSLAENSGSLGNDAKLFLALNTVMRSRRHSVGGGAPTSRAIAEVTVSHSRCLDHMRRRNQIAAVPPIRSNPVGGGGETAVPPTSPGGGLFSRWLPGGSNRKAKPTEFYVECSRGISQIHLQRQKASNSIVEYSIQTIRIHVLDVVAQLLL